MIESTIPDKVSTPTPEPMLPLRPTLPVTTTIAMPMIIMMMRVVKRMTMITKDKRKSCHTGKLGSASLPHL